MAEEASQMNAYLTRPAREDEVAAIAELFDSRFGIVEARAHDLEERLHDGTLHALVVNGGGKLLGAGVYSARGLRSSRDKLADDPALCAALAGAGKPIGWLEAAAVTEPAKTRGDRK